MVRGKILIPIPPFFLDLLILAMMVQASEKKFNHKIIY